MALPSVLVVPDRDDLAHKTALVGLDDLGKTTVALSYSQLRAAAREVLDGSFPRHRLRRGDTVALLMPNGVEVAVVLLALLRRGAVVFPLNPALKEDEIGRLLDDVRPAVVIAGIKNSKKVQAALGSRYTVAMAHRPDPEDPTAIVLDVLSGPAPTRAARDSLRPGEPEPEVTHDGSGGQLEGPGAQDAAVLLFTSGTTGRPKGAVLTHANILVSCDIIATNTRLGPGDTCMLITPLFHVAGLCASLLVTLLTGGTVVIPPFPPAPSFWQQIEDHKVTWFHAVPNLHRVLLAFDSFRHSGAGETTGQRRRRACRSLRFARSGGSAISQALFAEVEEALGRPLVEIYGLTETSPGIFCNLVDSPTPRRPCIFPVPPQVELRLVPTTKAAFVSNEDSGCLRLGGDAETGHQGGEAGEVWLRGPSVITRYAFGDPAQTALAFDDQGFFATGDLARRVPGGGGRIQLVGRVKEMINKAGEKISPQEVEDAVLTHGKVKEVACFAARDETFGEDVCAAVVLQTGQDLSAAELRKYLRRQLASYKVPRDIVFLQELPKTASGKYQRRQLSDRYGCAQPAKDE